jgi:hypothetical protein
VIDEKLSSSIVKLAGRNEIPETFWKSVGSALWTYTEIPKGKRYKLFDEIKDYQKKSKYTSVTMSDKLFDKCFHCPIQLKKFILVSGFTFKNQRQRLITCKNLGMVKWILTLFHSHW